MQPFNIWPPGIQSVLDAKKLYNGKKFEDLQNKKMENKSTKYYLLGGVVLIVIIIAVVLMTGKSKPVAQSPENLAPAKVTSLPTTSNLVPETNASAVTTPGSQVTTPPVASSASAPVADLPAANALIGNWNSSTQGKGMQGSGTAALNGITFQLNLSGDVNLVINKVENNAGTGTITFNNVCIGATKLVAGKPAVTEPAKCVKTYSQPAVMQIDGDKITYTGQTELGATVTLTGTFANDSMTGTFVRTSTSGNINGTFDLARAK